MTPGGKVARKLAGCCADKLLLVSLGDIIMVDVLLYGDLVDPFFPVAPEEDDECLPEDRATVR